MRPTVAIDFDGVLHSYQSGWTGVADIPDPPVHGAIDFLLRLEEEDYQPAIYSSRSKSLRGRRAMKDWLLVYSAIHFRKSMAAHLGNEDSTPLRRWENASLWAHSMEPPHVKEQDAGRWLVNQVAWPWFKPAAVVMLDDRAIRFTGRFPSTTEIANFKPWNRD